MCGGWWFETESYLNDDGHKGDWEEEEEEGDLFYLPTCVPWLFVSAVSYMTHHPPPAIRPPSMTIIIITLG